MSDWSSDVCSSDLFDMKDLESAGLVKFDFLGLKTLTVIQEAVNNVARTSGAEIDVLKLPITDPKTYELYASGETTAEIGRANVCTPVTNAHLVCRLLLEKKHKTLLYSQVIS